MVPTLSNFVVLLVVAKESLAKDVLKAAMCAAGEQLQYPLRFAQSALTLDSPHLQFLHLPGQMHPGSFILL